MENILINQTSKTPFINFNFDSGIIEMKGRSIIENTKNFYESLISDDLEKYIQNPQPKTIVKLAFEYYNTSSSVWIFQLLKKMAELIEAGKEVEITWYYYEDDMREIGEEYQRILEIPIKIIQANDNYSVN